MAMLMTNEVFARTWGERAGPAPAEDYWPTLIGAGQATSIPTCCSWPRRTGTWSGRSSSRASTSATTSASTTGWCTSRPSRCAAHLQADAGYQERLIRFIENHDEPRAAATFGPEQARAAAVVMSTLQGARLYHDGQLEGRRDAHPGVPRAAARRAARRGPARVLRAAAARGGRVRAARRRLALCDCAGWPDNDSLSAARRVVLVDAAPRATWSSSTSPTRRRRRGCACRGPTWPGGRGSSRTG